MENGIGATLREARSRRKVDLSEVEAAIKIRIRYLQAMENEEWDLLPGGAYTRGFIRTYASYLGLDGERLAEEYRRGTAPAAGERAPRRVEPVVSGAPRARGSRIPSRVLAAVVSLALVGLVVAIGLTGGDDDGNEPPSSISNAQQDGKRPAAESERKAATVQPGVAVSLEATDEVWVCMLDSDEEPVVDGEILQAGAEAGPFRAGGFTASFGNGEFELTIDGKPAQTPPSSSPIGYEIDAAGELTPLEEGERPDCT